MNIVHIAPNAPYNEGWGYQENLLPKYQAKLGHTVTLIVTNTKHENGLIVETEKEDYMSIDGFRVIRLPKINPLRNKLGAMWIHIEVYDLLKELTPDFVFYHGLVSTTINQVTKYKKNENPNLVIVQDNHLDYNIGFSPSSSIKNRILTEGYRRTYRENDKYISKVYGVTPWRRKYAEEVFKVPSSKTDVLIMGADDEKINFEKRREIRASLRLKYSVSDDDFLIVSGGKIDMKKKTVNLLKACVGMEKVKLIIFGQVLDDIKEEFDRLCAENNNITYIGWIDSDKVYDYFFAADLVVFPGQHSVLWEQACASKVPCVFEKWEGMDHVNNGGNSDFMTDVSKDGIRKKIEELLYTDKYWKMKQIAESTATDIYLYSKIAEKSLECMKN